MGCQRCGGRMLTKMRGQKALLICSDCAAPVAHDPDVLGTFSRQAGLLLIAMAGFVLLLLLLTNLKRNGLNPLPGDAPSEKVNDDRSESGSRP